MRFLNSIQCANVGNIPAYPPLQLLIEPPLCSIGPIVEMSLQAASNDPSEVEKYDAWVAAKQSKRHQGRTSRVIGAELINKQYEDTHEAPPFPHATLVHDGVEEYAVGMTTRPSDDFAFIASETRKAGLFEPCMVGKVTGQVLTMMVALQGGQRVLDIGCFTGYSALSFAHGMKDDGEVVTLEANAKTAAVARACIARSSVGHRVRIVECDAHAEVDRLADAGHSFDIVFLDADKTGYMHYYEAALRMLPPGGLVLADNALCSLLFAQDDPSRIALHKFAQHVRADPRVEQVMLTVDEGILMARKLEVGDSTMDAL